MNAEEAQTFERLCNKSQEAFLLAIELTIGRQSNIASRAVLSSYATHGSCFLRLS